MAGGLPRQASARDEREDEAPQGARHARLEHNSLGGADGRVPGA
jgi:hypothetical protein